MSFSPVKVEYVNPFVTAMIHAFRTMLQVELKRDHLYVKVDNRPSHEVSGIIGLSGKAKGTVVLGMDASVAMYFTELLTGDRSEQIDAHVIDAVGELTNIVAGSAKAQLESLEMSVSLPTVISGRDHMISFPTGAAAVGIVFSSPPGMICLEVSLVDA